MNHGVSTGELGQLANRVHIQFTKSRAMALSSPTNEEAPVLNAFLWFIGLKAVLSAYSMKLTQVLAESLLLPILQVLA